MNFQIGEKVVYPNQGIGTIENISTRSFGSAFERFYLLRFGCNSMTVLVPFSNAANIGLRRVTKDREIAHVLSYLSNGNCIYNSDWKVLPEISAMGVLQRALGKAGLTLPANL
jgi:CarD family transcriptional regulator